MVVVMEVGHGGEGPVCSTSRLTIFSLDYKWTKQSDVTVREYMRRLTSNVPIPHTQGPGMVTCCMAHLVRRSLLVEGGGLCASELSWPLDVGYDMVWVCYRDDGMRCAAEGS